MTTRTSTPTRRPRDRKAQILAAAVERFHTSGYHATGMDEIAAAVGISAGALYRHYRGKQELLAQALLRSTDLLLHALQDADGIEDLVRVLSGLSLHHRAYAALWERETRNLSPERREAVSEGQRRVRAIIAEAVGGARPELSGDDARFAARAVLSVFTSISYHRTELPRPRFELLLTQLADVAWHTMALPSAPHPAEEPSSPGAGLRPVSRREALLRAAIQQFREHGFSNVSMEDIGATAGIAGPSVYNHFASKTELLAAALSRGAEALYVDLARALEASTSEREALKRVLRDYASTMTSRSSPGRTLLGETGNLPEEQRESVHRMQVDYVAEWVALLRAHHPELDEGAARVTVHAVLTLVNTLSSLPPFARRTDQTELLTTIGWELLDSGARG